MYKIDLRLKSYELFAIETERLRLSVYKKSRAKEVTSYLVKNRDFHKRWSQSHDDNYFTERLQKQYLAYDVKEYHEGRLVPLWITLKDNPDVIIGKVSFFNFAFGGMMSCAIGYHIDADYSGNGYMTEAIKASCEMLVKELKIHRIEAFILPFNERSLNLIKRCGFTYEGRRISYMHINGKYEDHEGFYILDESFL